ncbi:response regulator transcription factor [bacterium]|nr:response regulator transcription factor [bacterium]
MSKIIVVEDDLSISTGVEYALEKEGYEVVVYPDGRQGDKGIRYHMQKSEPGPDLIILDIMLPYKNGYEICSQLRADKIYIPIIMLTAKSQEADKIKGLKSGADDYVSKPFSLKELLARVQAILRRSLPDRQSNEPVKVRLNPSCVIDFAKHEILRDNKKIALSEKEKKLLEYFFKNPGKVIAREEILEQVWNYTDELSFPTTRTVDNYIVKLRQLIEKDPNQPQQLKTVYRAGYKFEKDVNL